MGLTEPRDLHVTGYRCPTKSRFGLALPFSSLQCGFGFCDFLLDRCNPDFEFLAWMYRHCLTSETAQPPIGSMVMREKKERAEKAERGEGGKNPARRSINYVISKMPSCCFARCFNQSVHYTLLPNKRALRLFLIFTGEFPDLFTVLQAIFYILLPNLHI